MTPLQRYIASLIEPPFTRQHQNQNHQNQDERRQQGPSHLGRANDWSSVSEVLKVNGNNVVQTRKGILSVDFWKSNGNALICAKRRKEREREGETAAATRIATTAMHSGTRHNKNKPKKAKKSFKGGRERDGGGANDHHHFRPREGNSLEETQSRGRCR